MLCARNPQFRVFSVPLTSTVLKGTLPNDLLFSLVPFTQRKSSHFGRSKNFAVSCCIHCHCTMSIFDKNYHCFCNYLATSITTENFPFSQDKWTVCLHNISSRSSTRDGQCTTSNRIQPIPGLDDEMKRRGPGKGVLHAITVTAPVSCQLYFLRAT